jgi:hypothetical protein
MAENSEVPVDRFLSLWKWLNLANQGLETTNFIHFGGKGLVLDLAQATFQTRLTCFAIDQERSFAEDKFI